jgi:hypothetical protein
MGRRASSFGPLRCGLACLLLAMVAVGLDNSPARAECILQPNQQAPEGAHWSLHLDRTTNRRCWVLVDGNGTELSASPEPAAPVAVSPFQSFLNTFIPGPSPAAAPPAQEPPAAPAVAPPRRPAPRVATVAKPAVRTEHDSHPAGHDMTPEERDALFEEFLRWHQSQQMTGTAKDQPR